MPTLHGTIIIIEENTNYAICRSTAGQYYYFNTEECHESLAEEDQVNWTADPDDKMTMNTKVTYIQKANDVEKSN
ncbi:MAG: hypothetical protein JEZ03_09240 [Bacteroidales bacterium]|nr:hypothetical protein [Bacteroidales bacterium]